MGLVEDQVEPQVELEDLFIRRKTKVMADRPRVHPLVQHQVDKEQVHRILKRMKATADRPLIHLPFEEERVRLTLKRMQAIEVPPPILVVHPRSIPKLKSS